MLRCLRTCHRRAWGYPYREVPQVDETLNTKYSLRGRGRGRGPYGMGIGRGRGSAGQYPPDRPYRPYEQGERSEMPHDQRERPDRPYEQRGRPDRPDRPYDQRDQPDRQSEQLGPSQRGLPLHLQNRLSERAGPRGPPPDAELPVQVLHVGASTLEGALQCVQASELLGSTQCCVTCRCGDLATQLTGNCMINCTAAQLPRVAGIGARAGALCCPQGDVCRGGQRPGAHAYTGRGEQLLLAWQGPCSCTFFCLYFQVALQGVHTVVRHSRHTDICIRLAVIPLPCMQAPQQEPGIAKRPRETADSDNPAAVKRNRRMFAGLLGTLNQFKWVTQPCCIPHEPVQLWAMPVSIKAPSVCAAVALCTGIHC